MAKSAAEKALDKLREEDPEAAQAAAAAAAVAAGDFPDPDIPEGSDEQESAAPGANGLGAHSDVGSDGSLILREFGTAEVAIGHFVTPVGFPELPPNLSFEDYTAMCGGIGIFKSASLWMAGDALVYGENKWPDAYAQVADATGYDPGMLEIAQGLARAFPYETRHPKLPWTCHQTVKSLAPEEREIWLRRAEEGTNGHQWTRERLRDEIRIAQGKNKRGPGRPRKPENEGKPRAAKKPDEKGIAEVIERLEVNLKAVVKLAAAFGVEAQSTLDNLALHGGTSPREANALAKSIAALREKAAYLTKDLTALERHAMTVAEYVPAKPKAVKEKKAVKPKRAAKKK